MMTTRGFVSATRSVATWRRSRATDVTTTSEQASLIYLAPSASDHVDDGEDDDPDRVHEMPVPGHELHALDVRGLERPRPGEHADHRDARGRRAFNALRARVRRRCDHVLHPAPRLPPADRRFPVRRRALVLCRCDDPSRPGATTAARFAQDSETVGETAVGSVTARAWFAYPPSRVAISQLIRLC